MKENSMESETLNKRTRVREKEEESVSLTRKSSLHKTSFYPAAAATCLVRFETGSSVESGNWMRASIVRNRPGEDVDAQVFPGVCLNLLHIARGLQRFERVRANRMYNLRRLYYADVRSSHCLPHENNALLFERARVTTCSLGRIGKVDFLFFPQKTDRVKWFSSRVSPLFRC